MKLGEVIRGGLNNKGGNNHKEIWWETKTKPLLGKGYSLFDYSKTKFSEPWLLSIVAEIKVCIIVDKRGDLACITKIWQGARWKGIQMSGF